MGRLSAPPRLLFLAPGDIRKGRVQSIFFMRMSAAFARYGFDVRLFVPWLRRVDAIPKTAIWEHYGIGPTFRIRSLPTPLTAAAPTWWFQLVMTLASLSLALTEAARHLARPRTLVVYSRSPVFISAFVLLRFTFRRPRPRLAIEVHSLPKRYNRWIFRGVDLVVVNSERLRQHLASSMGVSLDRTLTASLAPYNDVRPMPRDQSRDALGLSPDSVIAAATGKMVEAQNEVLLQACRLLVDRIPRFHLMLVGGNPSILGWTRRRVAELGLDGRVILPGFVPPTQIDLYQSAADVLVMYVPGWFKTFSYATPARAYEYQRIGRPIVATDLPLFDELFGADLDRAIRINGAGPEEVASAVERALALPDAGRGMAQRAARWSERLSWETRVAVISAALKVHAEHKEGGAGPLPTGSSVGSDTQG
jgi:glycosyltransferase involved in cell wall biosynthesis